MSTRLRSNLWLGFVCLTAGWAASLSAAEPVPPPVPAPLPPAVEPAPPHGPLAEAPPPARHPPHAAQPQPAPAPAPLPDEPGAELDGELEQGPRTPLPGTVKLAIKRDGVEISLEAPAAMFNAEELKDLMANYLPRPDPTGLGVRVYSLRKRGIDIPAEVIEKLARKAAKGADEEQPVLNFHCDEPNRLLIVSAWEAVLLDRVDLVIDALGKEPENNNRMPGPQFMLPGMGGPGGPGMGPPPGGRGEAPAMGRPNPNNPDGGGPGGADAEMQRRKQMEQEQLQKRLDKERRKDNGRGAPEGGKQNNPEPAPPAHNEQF